MNEAFDSSSRDDLRTEQRFFARLTDNASWRSEYILRTKLIRSLARGKPAQTAPGASSSQRQGRGASHANAVVTYNSQLFATINHIHANFERDKKQPRFIHGTDETGTACISDPNTGKVDNWGLSDPQALPQYADLFSGDQLYGMGDGPAAVPNVMDISQPFGMVYGVGIPGAISYFRATDEMRGRFLAPSYGEAKYDIGIPAIKRKDESICAVWLAKSPTIPNITDGCVGILTGSSLGIITAYSLGADNHLENRLGKGEITAKWAVSPGVPIIAIAVDEQYNSSRKGQSRIFAVALNALGEVYYLTQPPKRVTIERGTLMPDDVLERYAWQTGRSCYWNLAEATRRVARDDPWKEAEFDGRYSPRSSADSMGLSPEQLAGEAREIEKFLSFQPAVFRKACHGWDMRRKLEVDFAGDDGNGAGENVVVIQSGVTEDQPVQITRFTRLSLRTESENRSADEWRTSNLLLPGFRGIEITAITCDLSKFALMTAAEDPLLATGRSSTVSSLDSSPVRDIASAAEMPGHRARFLAVGTNTGAVLVWNMRGPVAANAAVANDISPVRRIQTDSPQVSCLALSALYLVHGGNDGLVQTWDPLASTLQPLRTLNSRFSSRARRRLVQAEASVQGVGINLFAAGAIAIDPDPTVLRGMVSLGTHLRYWSYSSLAADPYASKKRRIRRSSERGNNSTQDKITVTGRGALMDYIATEQHELRLEEKRKAKEEARLQGRFGVGLHGLSEDDALRYAEMISQEEYLKSQAAAQDEYVRTQASALADVGYMADDAASSSATSQLGWDTETVTPEGSIVGTGAVSSPRTELKTDDELQRDIAEAIRLSMLDGVDDGGRSPRASGSGGHDIPIVYKDRQKKSKRSPSSSSSTGSFSASKSRTPMSPLAYHDEEVRLDDLEMALNLSLAEAQGSGQGVRDEEDFPGLQSPGSGKAKGKGRGW
jgi:hypothetical protein